MGLFDWIGDALGINQANAGATQQQQSNQMVEQSMQDLGVANQTARDATAYNTGQQKSLNEQAGQAEEGVKESLGKNAADEQSKAMKSSEGLAGKAAAGAGQAATETALEGARTAGENQGEAALGAGNKAEKAATGTYGNQLNAGMQQYENAAGQQMQNQQALGSQANAAGGLAATGTGQQIEAGQAAGQIGVGQGQNAQGSQQQAAGGLGGLLGGLLKDGGEFEVPPGHPNDSATLHVSSGEKVLVIPKGKTLRELRDAIKNKKPGEKGPITQQDVDGGSNNPMKELITHMAKIYANKPPVKACSGAMYKAQEGMAATVPQNPNVQVDPNVAAAEAATNQAISQNAQGMGQKQTSTNPNVQGGQGIGEAIKGIASLAPLIGL